MTTEHKTATEDTLSELHALTAEQMKKRLQYALATGEPLPPAEMSVIVKFLKDNEIECTKEDMQKQFSAVLKLKGPDFDEVEADCG